jgi:superfamily II DNA helicase RecQ
MAEASRIYFPPPPPPTGSNALRPVSDVVVHPSCLDMFQSFLGKLTAQWSCPEQGVVLEHLIQGKENILAVIGTGAGKTTLIMFLAKIFGQGSTTIVILPLASLHSDFHERAKQFGLIACKWKLSGKFNNHANIVTATIEDLQQQAFIK